VAVVGAGPAGLSCGHYLARLGHEVEIFEKANEPGGIPALAVPLSRLPREVLSREIDGLLLPGMQFHFGKALGRDFGVSDLQGDFGATFLAPGLWSGRALRVPGLDSSRSMDALEFLSASRGPRRQAPGSKVLVIGGGSAASDAALTAKNFGASQVTLVCLEARGEMPCLRAEVEEMTRKGIRIENRWGPKSASAASRLTFVRCLSVFDHTGEFSPVFDDSETLDLEFDRVILAVGQTVEPALAVCLKTEFGTEDRLEVDRETLQVADRAGVFAGGDIVRGAGTVVEAVADGRRAARSIDAFLREGPL
jgi:NADPH-dependent glutamate synthase beta subunit-like oxidoreductase